MDDARAGAAGARAGEAEKGGEDTVNRVLFSSKETVWSTPQDFFNKLNEEFDFTIDVCALPENAK